MIGSGIALRPALSRGFAAALLVAASACLVERPAAGAAPGAAAGSTHSPARLPAADDFQRGVSYAHVHRRDLGYGSAASRASLVRLRDLGVEWISITPFGYQETVRSTQIIFRGDPSLRDSALLRELRAIRGLGMKSILKPHLWGGDFYQGRWSGEIRMASEAEWETWFRSYETFILHFAALAERGGADALCVGSELGAATESKPDRWRQLIAKVRSHYHGPITYAANWYGEFERVPFWDVVDWIGVNAYFNLSRSLTPSAAEIERAWAPIASRMESLSRRWRRPIVLTEVGFRSVDRPAALTHGWPEFDQDPRPNPAAQAACYEGTFRALWGKPWLRGLYWWKYYSSPDGEGPEEVDFTPYGKPAEAVLSAYYRGEPLPRDLDKSAPGAEHGGQSGSSARPSRSSSGER